MIPGLGALMGGGGGLSTSSTATSGANNSGAQISPWYQGDIVVSYGDGDARSGDRTAPPATSLAGAGVVPGGYGASAGGSGIGIVPIAIAAGLVLVGVVWKLSR